MNLILNIGLDVNATRTIAAHVALEILKANDFIIDQHVVLQSDTEPTLVVRVRGLGSNGYVLGKIHETAVDLQQDCIAVYQPAFTRGWLVGPRAAAWGKFNPEFFFLLDGTRLAQPVNLAA